jgi:nickel/cobalt exporter
MPRRVCLLAMALASLTTLAAVFLIPSSSAAHPLGNFSISQYTGIQIRADVVEMHYLIDMAEIPTFQEIQETGIVPEAGHPGLRGYLTRKVGALKEGLRLEVDGLPLKIEIDSTEVIFPPGAGGLLTMKIGVRYWAKLPGPPAARPSQLYYRDGNFQSRAGWKEIIATGGRGIRLTESSVPAKDRSHELSDYPVDLLNSPPQDLEARVVFTRSELAPVPAAVESASPAPRGTVSQERHATPLAQTPPATTPPAEPAFVNVAPRATTTAGPTAPLGLEANKQRTPRSAFTELMSTKELNLGVVLIALAVAAGLGAFHALEPGHGKTVVAAYLVGSHGTAWHAVWLGLIVTASHTAGVYLLGAVTLYASKYVVPERLYPWLGLVSGLVIAGLGFTLFLRRYAETTSPHAHDHAHDHDHPHQHGHAHHHGPFGHSHDPEETSDAELGHHHPQHHEPSGRVSVAGLVTLGVTGGIVPCPAALVVLLSALSLNRVGFGLLLIVAFSVGLAAVLIAIGMLMVFARRFMARFQSEGPLITRWLPLTSSAMITLLGLGIAVQALVTAGVLQIHL